MAIKIIKQGKIPDTMKRFECDYCGCVFEGEKEDYQIIFCTDNTLAAAMNCPTCGAACYLPEAKIMRGEPHDNSKA